MLPDRVSNPGPLTYESGATFTFSSFHVFSFFLLFYFCLFVIFFLRLLACKSGILPHIIRKITKL